MFFPSFGWYLREGWKVDGDSEPSDAYIFWSRFGATIAILLGLYVLITRNIGPIFKY
ncbi:DUF6199 family natural product biosynthesis protein [Paenibacillus methanolicus]|uniref:DUF6199 family natural product biosynthesis protein n=1 Tax=Paenibacillus methanolicus TaxID=582686 RepID=UPI003CCC8DD3